MSENRKSDHIDLASSSQIDLKFVNKHFYYEPLLSSHPKKSEKLVTKFLGHTLSYPFWISSMTGGTEQAFLINQNLAKLCCEFKIGMGLGSTRSLLYQNDRFSDFNLRPIIGSGLPFFINLGIAQVEELVSKNEVEVIFKLIDRLSADGLIIHVNPIQEWLQPEGDSIKRPPIETIFEVHKLNRCPIIVKEVGQGMGPKSLSALIEMNISAIELAGFGGTNFSSLEIKRQSNIASASMNSLVNVGHTPEEMISYIEKIRKSRSISTEIIISGGIKDMSYAHFLQSKLKVPSIIGMGMHFLKHAKDYESLRQLFISEVETLMFCRQFLGLKEEV